MARLNDKWRSRWAAKARSRGTLLVEAAIVFPAVILLTFVLIEGGWLMLKAEQIENAARQGARKAALSGTVQSDAQTVVDNIMKGAGFASGSWTTTYTDKSGGTADFSKLSHGDPVSVKVAVAYSNISLTKVPLIFASGDSTKIGSTVTMTKE